MKSQEIIEGNKLVAEFMGHRVIGDVPGWDDETPVMMPIYNIETEHATGYVLDGMKYASSWDWLMPVVQKCLTITDEYERPFYDLQDALIYDTRISTVFDKTIEFIIWYNKREEV